MGRGWGWGRAGQGWDGIVYGNGWLAGWLAGYVYACGPRERRQAPCAQEIGPTLHMPNHQKLAVLTPILFSVLVGEASCPTYNSGAVFNGWSYQIF